ncbi:MAG TPA: hypothetical protein VN523_15535 [Hyphomicrobiaceae bacterium]|jgi:hypothetical protein|nr:hypothetical protein [Hyphomicrobiaceae bacterium]
MRAGLVGMMALLLAAAKAACALAETPCTKADFEAVVDEAAAALRTLNHQNTPQFQARLRQLKDKRGWSHEQFLLEASPFVRDEAIAAFDQKSEDFLARITQGGQSQVTAAAPNCGLLVELRGSLAALVETQKSKWTYMFDKINGELRR